MNRGQHVLVTGGSGGIGGAIAEACARRGGVPIIGYCSNEQGANDVLARCGRGETWPADLSADFGPAPAATAVVHCAAEFDAGRSLLAASDQTVARLVAVNVEGPLRLTRAMAAASRELKRVVFILSSASFCRGTGPYALSKAAELALCRLLANELAPRGVRVDAIVPGWTATAMAERAALAGGRDLDAVARQHPEGMLLEPREIGDLCAGLLFDHADSPPGNLIVWDRRDSAEPIWHALRPGCAEAECATGQSVIAN